MERHHVVTNEMLNCNGTLFGGVSMGWMDKLGHELSILLASQTMYTHTVERIKFHCPVFEGERVCVVGEAEELGPVKMVLRMTVYVEQEGESLRKAVEGRFVFVELDGEHRPHRIHYKSDVLAAWNQLKNIG